jgi:hypothetical protein
MKMLPEIRALGVGLGAIVILGACSQNTTPQTNTAPTIGSVDVGQVSTVVSQQATVVAGLDPRFNPTAAAGGGINASNVISADDIAAAFKSLPQASQLKLTANSSPPGAKGADVQSVSVVAQDTSGVLKGLDPNGKRALGDALLTAAGAAWPKASVSMLISDASGAGGQIIGSRGPDGTNTIIVS